MRRVATFFLFFTFEVCAAELNPSGYLRAMHVGCPDYHATAVGGSVAIKPQVSDFYADVAFFNSTPVGIQKDAVSKLFSSKESGYSILGVASVGYKKNGIDINVGRQRVSTPLVDMDDGRIVPNLYEGASIKYAIDDSNTFEGYYLSKMSGFWSTIYSGEDMSKFVSMSKAAGYGDITPNGALWAAGLRHNGKIAKINLWGYHSPNLLDTLYAELSYTKQLSHEGSLSISVQGVTQDSNGALKRHLDQIDKTLKQHHGGLKIAFLKNGFEGYGAATIVSDSGGRLDKDMMNVWAGIPQYTVFNEHVMKSFNTDGAKLYKTHLGQKFGQGMEASVSHIYVDGSDKRAVLDSSVWQILLSKSVKSFSISAMTLVRSDGGNHTNTILKSVLEYKF